MHNYYEEIEHECLEEWKVGSIWKSTFRDIFKSCPFLHFSNFMKALAIEAKPSRACLA